MRIIQTLFIRPLHTKRADSVGSQPSWYVMLSEGSFFKGGIVTAISHMELFSINICLIRKFIYIFLNKYAVFQNNFLPLCL